MSVLLLLIKLFFMALTLIIAITISRTVPIYDNLETLLLLLYSLCPCASLHLLTLKCVYFFSHRNRNIKRRYAQHFLV